MVETQDTPQLTDDERQKRRTLLAAPMGAPSAPAITPYGVSGGKVGPPAPAPDTSAPSISAKMPGPPELGSSNAETKITTPINPATPPIAPATPAPGFNSLEGIGQREQTIQNKLDPYSASNPTGHKSWGQVGLGGKIGKVFSGIGDVVAPGVMAEFPGTRLGQQAELSGLEDRYNKTAGDQANLAKNDKANWRATPGQQGPQGEAVETNQMTGEVRLVPKTAAGEQIENKTPEQKLGKQTILKDTNGKPYAYQNEKGEILPLDKAPADVQAAAGGAGEKAAPPVTRVMGTRTFQHVASNDTWKDVGAGPAGAGGAGGGGSFYPIFNADSSQAGFFNPKTKEFVNPIDGTSTKQAPAAVLSMGIQAKLMLPHISNLEEQIKKMGEEGKLHDIQGRWNDFMTGKAGFDDPEFAALRANLGLFNTGLMKAHVGGRGGQMLLEHFEDMANAKTMSAASLLGAISAEKEWLDAYATMAPGKGGKEGAAKQGGTPVNPAQPPKAGDIVDGHKFLGGDPALPASWQK